AVLLVADFLHPVDGLAIELFLYGDMGHGSGGCGAMPMLLTWRGPNYVARPNPLDRASPALCQASSSRHNQGLTQRVGVPCGTCTRLKSDAGADRPCWIACLE